MNSRIQLYPDCLRRIFECVADSEEYLHITHKNLYSCVLVNKLFCDNAIPILWRNPWNPNSNKSKNNYNKKLSITKTILSCLLQYHREQDTCKITSLEKFTKDPLFDYISYCRYINCQDIEKVTKMIIENKKELKIIINKDYKGIMMFEDIWKLFMKKCSNVEYLKLPCNIDITLLPGSQQCLRWLTELGCEVEREINQLTNFAGLYFCRNLSKINIKPLDRDDKDLATLIKVQNNLKEVNLFTYQHVVDDLKFIDKALSIQSNSLERLSLRGNFYFSSQNSFLSSLRNLKQLHIKFAKNDYIYNLLNMTTLPHLEFFSVQLNYYSFELSLDCYSKLISTTKGYLEGFEIINAARPPSKIMGLKSFIRSIITYCPLINHVKIWYVNDLLDDFKQLLIHAEFLHSIEFDFLKVKVNNYFNICDYNESQTRLLLDALITMSYQLNHLYFNNLWWLSPSGLTNFLESWKEKDIKLTLKIKSNEREDLNPYLVIINRFIEEDVLTKNSGKWIKEFPF